MSVVVLMEDVNKSVKTHKGHITAHVGMDTV